MDRLYCTRYRCNRMVIAVLGSPIQLYSETSPCIVDNSAFVIIGNGECGIAIKERCSPIVMLLVVESDHGENVTPGDGPLSQYINCECNRSWTAE